MSVQAPRHPTHSFTYNYKQNNWKNVTLQAGKTVNFVDTNIEHGSIQIVEFHGNRKNLGIIVDVYSENGALFCNVEASFADMLQWGWGLTPGMVKRNPDGTAPDPVGVPSYGVPYLTRWKDTMSEVDALGADDCWYSMLFTPPGGLEYHSRLHVRVFNRGTSDAVIRRLYVQRVVFAEKPRV